MSSDKGFLTPADKVFLRGGKKFTGEYAKQKRYKRRQSIRKRTRAAFHDFALLHETLDESERNKIFDPPAEDVDSLMRAMIDTIAFLYHALEGDVESNATGGRGVNYPFSQVLEAGVRLGETARHTDAVDDPWTEIVDVDFSVETYQPQRADLERAVEDLAENRGRGLSDSELRTIIMNAVGETISGPRPSPTIDGEPVDEYVDLHGLRGLAEQIEQKAKELDDEGAAEE